jgi:putative pyoverdin transport system ATP-binding/permease protein
VLIGCLVYLACLSRTLVVAMIIVVVIGALGYRILITRAYRFLQQARDMRDVLFQHFRELTEGMKELKLHAPRREAFLSERVATATDAAGAAALAGVKHHLIADAWTQLLFYGLLGGLLAVAHVGHGLPAERATGFMLVTLYMMSPVWGVIEAWPIFARAHVSLEKIRDLGLVLSPESTVRTRSAVAHAVAEWQQLHLDATTFSYPVDIDGQAFVLGPLDLTFRCGELVFIVGGNGSGKSTFVKLLTGLYSPQAGCIRLDNRQITDDSRESYRQHFSAVLSDFYVFDRLLGLDHSTLGLHVSRYLKELDLHAKLRVENGRFSTIALSHGQRKRLALLTALLEDRPIYVFDEWAADQDQHYREIFYRRLLLDLRARGKTIFVVSHDERYYDLADRIVRLELGRVVDVRRQASRRTASVRTVQTGSAQH